MRKGAFLEGLQRTRVTHTMQCCLSELETFEHCQVGDQHPLEESPSISTQDCIVQAGKVGELHDAASEFSQEQQDVQ